MLFLGARSALLNSFFLLPFAFSSSGDVLPFRKYDNSCLKLEFKNLY